MYENGGGKNMGYSKRDYTTKEEREKVVIEKGTPKNSSLHKIIDYMNQPNVKTFNALVTDKSFERLKNNKGRPQIFSSREECIEEVEGYFKLCYDYGILPTIASMALYLGFNKDSLYANMSNPTCNFSDVLKNAVAACHSMQELPALDGTLAQPTYIFNAKNYFGMKDTQDVSISATNQQQNNTQTIDAIKNQIQLENQQVIDYHENQ